MGKLLFYIFAFLAYFEDNFHLVVDVLAEVGIIKRSILAQQCGIRLREYHGFAGKLIEFTFHFFDMLGVVFANGENLHSNQ